jgi:hypothetical protein
MFLYMQASGIQTRRPQRLVRLELQTARRRSRMKAQNAPSLPTTCGAQHATGCWMSCCVLVSRVARPFCLVNSTTLATRNRTRSRESARLSRIRAKMLACI